MSLDGFATNDPNPITCSEFNFSGLYSADSFLSKTYSGVPFNHYAMIIRFNVALMGFWELSDQLRLTVSDGINNYVFDYSPKSNCFDWLSLCGTNTTDCIGSEQFELKHYTEKITLNFTSLNPENDTSIQAWGIKELIIAAKMCDPACNICFGPRQDQCTECSQDYYLVGNLCLKRCPAGYFKNNDLRVC